MFAKFVVCTIKVAAVRRNLVIVVFFKKKKFPVFAAQIHTTKLPKAYRSQILEFASQIFFR